MPGAPEAAEPFALCAALLRAGHPAASGALARCLAEPSGGPEGWTLLGDALAERDRYDAALVCFGRARRAAPSAALALRIGRALRGAGRAAEARAAFTEAAALDPSSAPARFLEGAAAQDAGDLAGAEAAYAAALHIDPALGEAALNLGTVRQARGDMAGARAAYGRAARLRPDGFARAAQSLTTERKGELWLDLAALRGALDRG